MITIRPILDTDILPHQYWPLPTNRPGQLSLVAIDESGKVHGVCWLADAGSTLVVLYTNATSQAAVLLWGHLERYALSKNFSIISTHVVGDRLMKILRKRGWAVSNDPSYSAAITLNIRGGR